VPSASAEADEFIPTRSSLLSRLRALDDGASWQDFFDTYWRLIYKTARKAGLSDAEAQDVVQETVLTVSRSIEGFTYDRTKGSFKGWLLNTTRWRILDCLRERRRRAQVEIPEAEARVRECRAETDELAASAHVAAYWDEDWQRNLLEAAMWRIRHRVKPKQFQVFELNALKEWPAAKVAETLGVNIAQVYLTKHRVGRLIKQEVRRLQEEGV
jgi:RNA polymerase sigma-70 factor (ECF subfamily)